MGSTNLPKRLAGLGVPLAMALALMTPPAAAALDSTQRPDNTVAIAVPSVPGGTQLWVDVEAPGLTASEVVVTHDGATVTLRSTPLGAGAILPHAGAATSLVVGTRIDSAPDVAITIADADGTILHSDHARLNLNALSGEGPSPSPTPTVTLGPAPSPSHSTGRPRPGLPSTGAQR